MARVTDAWVLRRRERDRGGPPDHQVDPRSEEEDRARTEPFGALCARGHTAASTGEVVSGGVRGPESNVREGGVRSAPTNAWKPPK